MASELLIDDGSPMHHSISADRDDRSDKAGSACGKLHWLCVLMIDVRFAMRGFISHFRDASKLIARYGWHLSIIGFICISL